MGGQGMIATAEGDPKGEEDNASGTSPTRVQTAKTVLINARMSANSTLTNSRLLRYCRNCSCFWASTRTQSTTAIVRMTGLG